MEDFEDGELLQTMTSLLGNLTLSKKNETVDVGNGNDIISDSWMVYIETINLGAICPAFCLVGIVTNIINIIVFRRQGFQETINISLFSLSISDIISLVTLLMFTMGYNPFLVYSDLPIISKEVFHFPWGWSHFVFVRISGLITVFVILERCLCITFPLKIKSMLNPWRVKMIIFSIFVFAIISQFPAYFTMVFKWKFLPEQNRSMLGITRTENTSAIMSYIYGLQPFYPVFSFTFALVCSYILVHRIRKQSKWRSTASVSSNVDKATTRDQQIVKMVMVVAIIFIIGYFPSLILFIVMCIDPQMNKGMKHENSFILCLSVSQIFDSVNSTVNILAYYKTNSSYRRHFNYLFFKEKIAT